METEQTRERDRRKPNETLRQWMERLAWERTHPDFRGTYEDGTRTVLAYSDRIGPHLVAVSSLTDAELIERARVRS